MTLARRMMLGAPQPGECSFVSQENLQKIKEIAAGEKVVRKHPHPNVNEDIIEIHPCTEDGKVTLEAQLRCRVNKDDLYSDFFDQYHLCDALSVVDMFDKMNCSPKMGYAYVEIRGKRVHIFKTGKIIMRRAENREDALRTYSKISRSLLPARICSCGNILADCFAGACEQCFGVGCAALFDTLDDIEEGDVGRTTIGEVLEGSDGGSLLADNFKALGDIVSEIRKIDDVLGKGMLKNNDDHKNKTDEILPKVNKACIGTILDPKDSIGTILALTQYGLGRDLIRARDGLLSLEKLENHGIREDAMEILIDAYDTFKGRDAKGSKAIWKRYDEFMSNWEPNPSSVGVAKIAANGFYISRILGKTVNIEL